MAKESICRNCFHSYVCEQFNENKDDSNEKCHFFNDHYVSTADVVPKSEVDWHREAELNAQRIIELEAEVERLQKELSGHKQYYFISKTNVEVAREIFEEIENMISPMLGLEDDKEYVAILSKNFSELKKKYTEV